MTIEAAYTPQLTSKEWIRAGIYPPAPVQQSPAERPLWRDVELALMWDFETNSGDLETWYEDGLNFYRALLARSMKGE